MLTYGLRTLATLLVACAVLAPPASAQSSEQPVRIIFPFAAGGSGDALARILAEHLRTTPYHGAGWIGVEAQRTPFEIHRDIRCAFGVHGDFLANFRHVTLRAIRKHDRGRMSALKRNAGEMLPGRETSWFYSLLPKAPEQRRHREVYYLIATLFDFNRLEGRKGAGAR